MKSSIALIAFATLGAYAAPLPNGPPGHQLWIKINEVEHAVPPYMTPDQFYNMMTAGRPQTPPRASVVPPYHPVQTFNFPRPAPRLAAPAPFQRPLSAFNAAPQPFHSDVPVSSFHVGFQTAQAPPPPPVFQAPPARPTFQAPTRPIITLPAYRQPPPPAFPQPFLGGQRQWVKIAEGTQPIEVPAGADPQQFLAGIKASRGVRFLRKKKDDYAGGPKYIILPAPAPVVVAPAPPPPPPPAPIAPVTKGYLPPVPFATKTVYEMLPSVVTSKGYGGGFGGKGGFGGLGGAYFGGKGGAFGPQFGMGGEYGGKGF